MLISWSERFETGIDEIDRQHKNLFEIMERLHEAKRGDGIDIDHKVDATAKELLSYAKIHFETEERMMEKCNYKGIEEHRMIHFKFQEKAQHYEKRIRESRGDMFLAMEMMNFMIDWIIGHVSVTDMEYVECIAGNCADDR